MYDASDRGHATLAFLQYCGKLSDITDITFEDCNIDSSSLQI